MTGQIVDDARIAWIAGVLDCRGRFCAKTAKRKISGKQISIELNSSDITIVQVLSGIFGVKPYLRPNAEFSRIQCSSHCPDDHVHVLKGASGRFEIAGVTAAIASFNVQRHMMINRDSAIELFGDYLATYSGGKMDARGRAQAVGAISKMRGNGWKIPEEIEGMI